MTFEELLKNLTDNLTDEQKTMPALFADTDGNHYPVDALYVIAMSSTDTMPEGQAVMACFGIDDVETKD
jgi:hypothetical protein